MPEDFELDAGPVAPPTPISQLRHHLEVRFGDGWLDGRLTCLNPRTAACHVWAETEDGREDEDHPATEHDDCNVVDWWNEDTAGSLQDGYAGETRNSILSGDIFVTSWGEDGIEWDYS